MKRKPGLFYGHWRDPATGARLRRATRAELGEAWRLWARHRDIRENRAQAAFGDDPGRAGGSAVSAFRNREIEERLR